MPKSWNAPTALSYPEKIKDFSARERGILQKRDPLWYYGIMDFKQCSDISPNVTEAGVNPAALAAWDNILSEQFERAALASPGSDPCQERREDVVRSLPKTKPAIGPR